MYLVAETGPNSGWMKFENQANLSWLNWNWTNLSLMKSLNSNWMSYLEMNCWGMKSAVCFVAVV